MNEILEVVSKVPNSDTGIKAEKLDAETGNDGKILVGKTDGTVVWEDQEEGGSSSTADVAIGAKYFDLQATVSAISSNELTLTLNENIPVDHLYPGIPLVFTGSNETAEDSWAAGKYGIVKSLDAGDSSKYINTSIATTKQASGLYSGTITNPSSNIIDQLVYDPQNGDVTLYVDQSALNAALETSTPKSLRITIKGQTTNLPIFAANTYRGRITPGRENSVNLDIFLVALKGHYGTLTLKRLVPSLAVGEKLYRIDPVTNYATIGHEDSGPNAMVKRSTMEEEIKSANSFLPINITSSNNTLDYQDGSIDIPSSEYKTKEDILSAIQTQLVAKSSEKSLSFSGSVVSTPYSFYDHDAVINGATVLVDITRIFQVQGIFYATIRTTDRLRTTLLVKCAIGISGVVTLSELDGFAPGSERINVDPRLVKRSEDGNLSVVNASGEVWSITPTGEFTLIKSYSGNSIHFSEGIEYEGNYILISDNKLYSSGLDEFGRFNGEYLHITTIRAASDSDPVDATYNIRGLYKAGRKLTVFSSPNIGNAEGKLLDLTIDDKGLPSGDYLEIDKIPGSTKGELVRREAISTFLTVGDKLLYYGGKIYTFSTEETAEVTISAALEGSSLVFSGEKEFIFSGSAIYSMGFYRQSKYILKSRYIGDSLENPSGYESIIFDNLNGEVKRLFPKSLLPVVIDSDNNEINFTKEGETKKVTLSDGIYNSTVSVLQAIEDSLPVEYSSASILPNVISTAFTQSSQVAFDIVADGVTHRNAATLTSAIKLSDGKLYASFVNSNPVPGVFEEPEINFLGILNIDSDDNIHVSIPADFTYNENLEGETLYPSIAEFIDDSTMILATANGATYTANINGYIEQISESYNPPDSYL